MSKRLTTILFLTILLAPPIASYTWLYLYKKSVKREIKWKLAYDIEKEELVTLKITGRDSSKLRWEHSREFEFEGEMYDVVYLEQHGDTIIYHCWWDNEETQLNQKLATLVNKALGNSQEKEQKQDQLISYFKSLYHSNWFSWVSSVSYIEFHPGHSYIFHFIGTDSEVPTPPPRFC